MPSDAPDAKLRWEGDAIPVSIQFDDPYYSREDGLAEAEFVFLDGNGLPARFQGATRFRIAELGFGTGLNFLAVLRAWRSAAPAGAILEYTSFEMFPMRHADHQRALERWPELSGLANELFDAMTPMGASLPGANLTLVTGDARSTVPAWEGEADAWFLDGFAPARNPEMWEAPLLAAVYARTVPGGTVATYTAAGAVRRALQDAGFEVSRTPGFGRKREKLIAVRPE